MRIDNETVQNVAKLAKLRFSNVEAEILAKELEEILRYFKINNGEELTDFVSDCMYIDGTVLRSDGVLAFENRQALFQNSRHMKDGFVVIPKVLD